MTMQKSELSHMKKILWLLLDDRMGSVGQARGVAQFLSADFEIVEKHISYTRLAKLPNFLKGAGLLGLAAESKKAVAEPAPDLVISASRRTAPVARWIKKRSGGKTVIAQIMYPGKSGIKDLDMVFVSEHDKKKKFYPNFTYIVGSPHRITPQTLEEARRKWEPVFAGLPKPLTAVIVGGAIKGHPFSLENAEWLGRAVKEFKQEFGGAVLITDSRRTGKAAQDIIMNELSAVPAYTYLWGEDKENPFIGFLACCDNIIVTGDSVTMCCEACGTGKPVYIFEGDDWLSHKHQRFVASLYRSGYAFPLEENARGSFVSRGALNPAAEVAEIIRRRFTKL